MIVSGYSMDLYCDGEGCKEHPGMKWSAPMSGTFCEPTKRLSHHAAKMEGWRLGPREKWCLCPKCVAEKVKPKLEVE